MPLTIELAVRVLCTQCKCCSAGACITPFSHGSYLCSLRQSQRSKDRLRLHVMASNTCPPQWRAPHLHHFCFTSSQPATPKEASDSISTIRDVMPLTVEHAVRFLRTQSKRCLTGAFTQSL